MKIKPHIYEILTYQQLTEEMIRQHIQYADDKFWYLISKYQVLSPNFIIRHKDQLDWFEICMNQKVTYTVINKCADYLFVDLIDKNIFKVAQKDSYYDNIEI
jgi:hypothetical protein